jgi:hypothetical protein
LFFAALHRAAIARGDQVRLSAQAGRLHFFDVETAPTISG